MNSGSKNIPEFLSYVYLKKVLCFFLLKRKSLFGKNNKELKYFFGIRYLIRRVYKI